MRLYTLALAVVFSFSQICAAATPPATRILLVTDPHNESAAAWLLAQALEQTLDSRDDIYVATILPRTSKDARALTLRRDAQITLQRASLAYNSLRLDDALHDAGAAAQKLARVASLTGDVTLLPQALGLLSAIYLMLDQPAAATATQQRLITVAADYAPPAAIYNPTMLAAWSAARAQAAAAMPVQLSVRVTPADALCILDGAVHTAPTAHIAPGMHVLTVAHQGFEPTTVQLDAAAGGTLDVTLALAQRPAYPEDILVTDLMRELGGDDKAARALERDDRARPALENLIRRHQLDGVLALSQQGTGLVLHYVDARTRVQARRLIVETINNQKAAAHLASDVTAAYR